MTWNTIRREYHNSFPVEHEVVKLLHYGGEKCNHSINYDYHECVGNQIHKVRGTLIYTLHKLIIWILIFICP